MTAVLTAVLLLAAPSAGGRPGPYEREISAAIAEVRHVYVVPASLVKAVIHTESAWNASARSHVGAIGLMQVMPFNAEKLGVTESELWVPSKNILAGTRLLAVLLRHYEGDVISALVAYNSGPKRKGARLPDNGETPAYVWRVLAAWRAFRSSSP